MYNLIMKNIFVLFTYFWDIFLYYLNTTYIIYYFRYHVIRILFLYNQVNFVIHKIIVINLKNVTFIIYYYDYHYQFDLQIFLIYHNLVIFLYNIFIIINHLFLQLMLNCIIIINLYLKSNLSVYWNCL